MCKGVVPVVTASVRSGCAFHDDDRACLLLLLRGGWLCGVRSAVQWHCGCLRSASTDLQTLAIRSLVWTHGAAVVAFLTMYIFDVLGHSTEQVADNVP
jgi:hypothetical protein